MEADTAPTGSGLWSNGSIVRQPRDDAKVSRVISRNFTHFAYIFLMDFFSLVWQGELRAVVSAIRSNHSIVNEVDVSPFGSG